MNISANLVKSRPGRRLCRLCELLCGRRLFWGYFVGRWDLKLLVHDALFGNRRGLRGRHASEDLENLHMTLRRDLRVESDFKHFVMDR